MADVAVEKETKVASPEKKVEKEVVEKKPVEETESKTENGDEPVAKENGSAEEKTEEKEEAKNGDAEAKNGAKEDACSIKRKSVGADATDGSKAADGATPEKKAKLDEKVEESSNGEAEATA